MAVDFTELMLSWHNSALYFPDSTWGLYIFSWHRFCFFNIWHFHKTCNLDGNSNSHPILKIANLIMRRQWKYRCSITTGELRIKSKPLCRWWRSLMRFYTLQTDILCDIFVYSHRELFRPCLFWAEFLCSFPLCCPHTLWQVASCCLISRPSDTHVPSAHQGVHTVNGGRGHPVPLFFFPYLLFSLPHFVSPQSWNVLTMLVKSLSMAQTEISELLRIAIKFGINFRFLTPRGWVQLTLVLPSPFFWHQHDADIWTVITLLVPWLLTKTYH